MGVDEQESRGGIDWLRSCSKLIGRTHASNEHTPSVEVQSELRDGNSGDAIDSSGRVLLQTSEHVRGRHAAAHFAVRVHAPQTAD